MKTIHIEKSAVIDAQPEAVYAIISDYRVGHRAILPKPYFVDMIVKEGGNGAGTKLEFAMNVFGAKRTYHQVVSEPEPGRVLVEDDAEAGVKTTFTIDPLAGGKQSRITIQTEVRPSPGISGWMERLMNPPITRYIYDKELQNLADYVANRQV